MSLKALRRIVRTAEFRLPVIYALLFTASATILGTLFYWTILSSLERQMTTRIDAELEILKEDFRFEGEHELLEEVERRNNVLAFEYLLLDKQGQRVAGNLPVTPRLWLEQFSKQERPFWRPAHAVFSRSHCADGQRMASVGCRGPSIRA